MSRLVGGPADGVEVDVDSAPVVVVAFVPAGIAQPIGPDTIAMIRDAETGELRTPHPAMGEARYERRVSYHFVSEHITPGELA